MAGIRPNQQIPRSLERKIDLCGLRCGCGRVQDQAERTMLGRFAQLVGMKMRYLGGRCHRNQRQAESNNPADG
jgi:hypothetical protein